MVSAIFLPLLDYGDLLYMNVPGGHYLKQLDSVFHSALRFITGCNYQTHHCTLYEKAALPSLHTRRSLNCFIYKSICCLTLSSLSLSFSNLKVCYKIRSNDPLCFKVPRVQTESGKGF